MNDTLNPFDPASLRLDQSFTDGTQVKKLLTTIPVRKPKGQDFVRVHPDANYRLCPAAIIELKDERETYLVTPVIAADLVGEITAVAIYTAINRLGVVHLWPVRLPTPDGRANSWHNSAQIAVDLAMKRWVRMTANMSLGGYDIAEAAGNIPDPIWPDLPFTELLKIAFRDRLIDRLDHPVIQHLRGA